MKAISGFESPAEYVSKVILNTLNLSTKPLIPSSCSPEAKNITSISHILAATGLTISSVYLFNQEYNPELMEITKNTIASLLTIRAIRNLGRSILIQINE